MAHATKHTRVHNVYDYINDSSENIVASSVYRFRDDIALT